MESGGTIVTAGLPFDPGDLGIVTEVIEGWPHDGRDGLGVDAVRAWIGHETFTPSECGEEKRAEVGHPDGALGLCVGAQLTVVGREELFSDRHRLIVAIVRPCRQWIKASASRPRDRSRCFSLLASTGPPARGAKNIPAPPASRL